MERVETNNPSTKYRTVSDIEVSLINPDRVKNYLYDTGVFASVCQDESREFMDDLAENAHRETYERIGMHCISAGHWSPARAVYFWFNINNISRVCSHQVVRSRIGVEINQRSQRSCKETSENIVVPPTIIASSEALEVFLDAVSHSYKAYNKLIELGVPMDDARYVLVQAGITGMNIALTPQALFQFFNERLCSTAQWEIRNMAYQMMLQVLAIEPRLRPWCKPKCVRTKGCKEGKNGCNYYDDYRELDAEGRR